MRERNGIDRGSLFWGLFLVALGMVLLLDELRVADFHRLVEDYWPLIVVAFGVSRILRRRSLWSGFRLVAVGTWLQISNLHLFGMNYETSWPLLLVIVGVGIVGRALFDPRRPSTLIPPEDPHV